MTFEQLLQRELTIRQHNMVIAKRDGAPNYGLNKLECNLINFRTVFEKSFEELRGGGDEN